MRSTQIDLLFGTCKLKKYVTAAFPSHVVVGGGVVVVVVVVVIVVVVVGAARRFLAT